MACHVSCTVGLTVGIDLPAGPTPSEAAEAMEMAFHEQDLLVRGVGDTLALSAVIVGEAQIGEIFDKCPIIKAVA